MLTELLKLVLMIFFRIFGFGLEGEGEFEDSKIFRRKINLRIQKEKSEGLPLFEGSYKDVNEIIIIITIRHLIYIFNLGC